MCSEPICRVADIRAIETRMSGQPLMERAGLSAAALARDMLADRRARVLVLAGPGNNGGDAFVVARHLASWFFDVVVCALDPAARVPADARAARAAWRENGGATVPDWNGDRDFGLIVDGLFGIGLTRAIDEVHARWIVQANDSRIPILALDAPSGLDAETGVAQAPTIRARATATFIALKPGLLTLDGPDHCGAISVHRLDVPDDAIPATAGKLLDWAVLRTALPDALARARRNVHKGSYGTLGVVGGGDGMVGAPLLAARAALHLGAGKVLVGFAARERPAVDSQQPELMLRGAADVLERTLDAIVIGPGLGTGETARDLLDGALRLPKPLVLDADALTLIAADAALAAAVIARSAPTIVTPHPAEAARLAGVKTSDIQSNRVEAALTLARRYNAGVVVKGAGSVLAYPGGAWAINGSGNPGLASAGTGDVLAGMVGALLAQGIAIGEALPLAVCLHGAASDALVTQGVGPLGLTASELAPAARRLLNDASRT
ncbi:MAG TPA: NAD(P)H-hydrate dehydratase [Casimicrobiaceae bacterium]|nr:NAD(P)H-hydrate dehydratase [Casimicrobiaceae bacterium]